MASVKTEKVPVTVIKEQEVLVLTLEDCRGLSYALHRAKSDPASFTDHETKTIKDVHVLIRELLDRNAD